jgi:hypothetical protein
VNNSPNPGNDKSTGSMPMDGSVPSEFDLWFDDQDPEVQALVTNHIDELFREVVDNRKERDVLKAGLKDLLIAREEECTAIRVILRHK